MYIGIYVPVKSNFVAQVKWHFRLLKVGKTYKISYNSLYQLSHFFFFFFSFWTSFSSFISAKCFLLPQSPQNHNQEDWPSSLGQLLPSCLWLAQAYFVWRVILPGHESWSFWPASDTSPVCLNNACEIQREGWAKSWGAHTSLTCVHPQLWRHFRHSCRWCQSSSASLVTGQVDLHSAHVHRIGQTVCRETLKTQKSS